MRSTFEVPEVSGLSGAAVDRSGNLWAVRDGMRSARLVRIRRDGEMDLEVELPDRIKAAPPSYTADFKLAALPSGQLVVLARYFAFRWGERATAMERVLRASVLKGNSVR